MGKELNPPRSTNKHPSSRSLLNTAFYDFFLLAIKKGSTELHQTNYKLVLAIAILATCHSPTHRHADTHTNKQISQCTFRQHTHKYTHARALGKQERKSARATVSRMSVCVLRFCNNFVFISNLNFVFISPSTLECFWNSIVFPFTFTNYVILKAKSAPMANSILSLSFQNPLIACLDEGKPIYFVYCAISCILSVFLWSHVLPLFFPLRAFLRCVKKIQLFGGSILVWRFLAESPRLRH